MDIDWSNLGFVFREGITPCYHNNSILKHTVNGHIESHYSKKTGEWTAPQFITDPYLRIHGMAPGLNYGQQVFEGQKAHRTPDGKIILFRPRRIMHEWSTLPKL